ncbi:MAG: aminoacyl-tRNA hydrolase [Armatimonadetes bacterium]|nr:aminoacyl-tRNA hydrolase [Armatimonadota bacterium]
MPWCIVGIGNPAQQYADTKHNVGWWVVDELCRRHNVRLNRQRLRAEYGRGTIAGQDVVLAKPLTFVNASGDAALRLALFFRIKPEQFVVVLDDMNLPPGTIRLRRGGSDGGHKGLRSILQIFGTPDVPRLRIGVGSPPPGTNPVEWVLSPFEESVLPVIREAVGRAADCIETLLACGFERAMQQFNG